MKRNFAIVVALVAVALTLPFGSAKAQTPPPTCAQQMQVCKEQVHDTRGACLQQCSNNADPKTCQQTAQDQFVAGIDSCNNLFQQCTAGQAPGGSYTLTCSDISVSDGNTECAMCPYSGPAAEYVASQRVCLPR
jgi:hypothetical protein